MPKKSKPRNRRARFMSKDEMRDLAFFIAAIIQKPKRRKVARSRKE